MRRILLGICLGSLLGATLACVIVLTAYVAVFMWRAEMSRYD